MNILGQFALLRDTKRYQDGRIAMARQEAEGLLESCQLWPLVRQTINLKTWFSSFLARKNINANPTGVHKSKTMFECRMYCMSQSPDKCELWVEELEQCLQSIQSQNVGNHMSDEAPSFLDHRWDCIPNVFQEPDTLTLSGHYDSVLDKDWDTYCPECSYCPGWRMEETEKNIKGPVHHGKMPRGSGLP